jgi:hypothetical protein
MNDAHPVRGNPSRSNSGSPELAALCANHLRDEEALLAAALPLVRAVKNAFGARGFDTFAAALGRHQEFAQMIEKMNVRRMHFRESLGRHLELPSQEVTLSAALARLPDHSALAADAARVKRLVDELASLNYWVSVHLRIHLKAYRNILRDLTNTRAGSGRYGPGGKAESLEYRPLFQIHG